MSGKFGQSRSRPEGDWVQTTALLDVVGMTHRKADASAFAQAVRMAERRGLDYGLRLEPDPSNSHDPCAVKVIGHAMVKPLFGVPRPNTWHIGFVPREVARDLTEDLVRTGHPYCAELYGIFVGDGGFIDVEFFVLVPKGSPGALRHARRAAGSAQGAEPTLTEAQGSHLRDGHLGLYRNTRLEQAAALKRLDDVEGALDMYLRVAWLDEHGPSNGPGAFDAADVFTAPGITKAIAQGANTLGLSLEQVRDRFAECGLRERRALGGRAPKAAADPWPRIAGLVTEVMASGSKWRRAKRTPV